MTSQNHGYCVKEGTLADGWLPLFLNANDGTFEGIVHATRPLFAVQFHPEAHGGPDDTTFLIDRFVDATRRHAVSPSSTPSPLFALPADVAAGESRRWMSSWSSALIIDDRRRSTTTSS